MKKYPWFKSYDAHVPRTLKPYPSVTVLDWLSDYLKLKPEHPIAIFQGRELSYREVEEHSNALAKALIENGVKKGDRVATLFLNCPQVFMANFAIWKAGGIVVPLNPLYTPFELEHAIQIVDAEVAIVTSMWYPVVKGLQPKTKLRNLIVTDLDTYAVKPMKKEGNSVKLEQQDSWWSDLIELYQGAQRPPAKIAKEDTAVILFSGGTTGAPKGVMSSHQAIIMTALQYGAWYRKTMVEWTDKMLANLPMFHAFGFFTAFGTYFNYHVPQVLIPNPRDLKGLMELIRNHEIAMISTTPTLMISILHSPDLKPGDLKSVRMVGSGAAPLMSGTKLQTEKIIASDGVVIEGYGMTESSIAGTAIPLHGQWKEGSVGCPIPDVIIRIVDMETGTKELNTGETGEIVIDAPNLMQGYWKNPTETAEAMRDGRLYTGDIGYVDEDGYVFITSRKKDLIKCGGFQVWPRDVEDVLMMHPAVLEVCVGGIPDPRQGEAVKAWIVLKEGTTATEEELQAFAKQQLTGYKVPRFYEFRKVLPKTMVGKVMRRILQDEEKGK
ncbi:MAG: AMP-binding protein [Dehalococcoidia bacterium]